MIKVVLGTNVLISVILFGGPPREVLSLVITGKIKNYISKHILDEISDVLKRPKFGFDITKLTAIIREIEALSELVELKEEIDIITVDRDDDYILACAITAEVDYLITGDNDLLNLNEYQGIKIIMPAGFLNIITT